MIALENFNQTLRDYQQDAVNRALAVKHGERLLLAAPTGTGKGSIELALLKALLARGEDTIICTPSLEVLRGYLERCGATQEDLAGSGGSLQRYGEQVIKVWTPVRLRNQLRAGRLQPPTAVIVDEAHHATDENVVGGGLRALVPNAAWIGFTATPYRGTPEETKGLHEAWGNPHIVLTIPQAVTNKSWALPTWRVKALINDDECGIKGGDLDADEITVDHVESLGAFVATLDLAVPTCVTVPGVKAAHALAGELTQKHGKEVRVVLGETPTQERAEAYTRVAQGGAVLVSVKVLGEGVDMPWLRRWVDASPTLSPVAFLQKLGRITRPNGIQPEYIGTNRNLERHGYLLQGTLPRDEIRKAQEEFGGASERGGRAGLIKAVRKLAPIQLPLAGGVKGTMWALWCPSPQGGRGFERCILLDPTSDRVISAMRDITTDITVCWQAAELPESIEGFRVARLNRPCSTRQAGWWLRSAEQYGLDVNVTPSGAQFFALPVLHDLHVSMDPNVTLAPLAPKPKMTNQVMPWAGAPGVQKDLFAPKNTPTNTPGTGPAAPGGVQAPKEPAVSDAPIKRGYFTVTREDGSHRTYRLRTMDANSAFAPGKTVLDLLTGPDNTASYTGVAFVDAEGLRVWSRFTGKAAEFRKDWAAIVGDKDGAGKRYAMQSGKCFCCGRLLTNPTSIASGIGPECASKGI